MSKAHHPQQQQHHPQHHHHLHHQESLCARVGKYELGRVLGEGTLSKVKFARNIETGQSVAIKIIDKERILKNKLVEQIKREVSIMKLVKHPNVIQMFEIMASKTKIYFVIEYVTGGELFNKIALEGRLKEDEARKYFQQLVNAVDYCHSRGVYHRDLKPENLLLDKDGNLKISGFGLSALPQQLREDGLLHTTCGTPNYVAPEVIIQKGYDGAKADVWTCGIVLFVLMAGYLPFDESNLIKLYRKIHKAEFVFPRWFSSKARKLIARILNPDPNLRITISEIMQESWFTKGYVPSQFVEVKNISLDDVDAVFNDSKEQLVVDKKEEKPMKPTFFNAFELIALSKGLNLSGLFEKKQDLKRERHFTSKHPASEIITKMEETARPLGFIVQTDNYKMKLQGAEMGRKGHLSVATEVFEVTPSFFMVEVKKDGGDTLEYQKFYQKFSRGLKDIVWKDEIEL